MLGISVTEPSRVAEVRRETMACARAYGLAQPDAERAALIATELATNLVRHATDGEMLIGLCTVDGSPGVQLIALDGGPGMRDPETCLRDGYSTAGGAGTGLGAVRRLADRLDIHSVWQVGTVVVARVLPKRRPAPAPDTCPLEWDAVVRPKPGEQACGDGWSARADASGATFLLSDGIGHGALAASATAAAIRVFDREGDRGPAGAMQTIHAALAGTRGAAAAIAAVDTDAREMRYCGIGNISATVFLRDGARKAVSHNGTLGHSVRKVQEFTYPYSEDAVLVMHSDGLGTRWSLDDEPGLSRHPPITIAAALYRRHRRGRDDAAVLVVKPR